MAEKIIIENRSRFEISEILGHVKYVIDQGRISETSKGKQYCFFSTFNDGIGVITDKNKCSDRFVIVNQKEYDQ